MLGGGGVGAEFSVDVGSPEDVEPLVGTTGTAANGVGAGSVVTGGGVGVGVDTGFGGVSVVGAMSASVDELMTALGALG